MQFSWIMFISSFLLDYLAFKITFGWGLYREVPVYLPASVYTSRKSPAAMEKSAFSGRSAGFKSGKCMACVWSSNVRLLQNWCTQGYRANRFVSQHLLWKENRACQWCHPGGHCWGYYLNILSNLQVPNLQMNCNNFTLTCVIYIA